MCPDAGFTGGTVVQGQATIGVRSKASCCAEVVEQQIYGVLVEWTVGA